ncbi:MAG: hypothetical protein DRJ03_18215 [Chloroflexi bacterium]|nr:MAG: hypothetical protein DRJ03_18215 [Chloroflexota bacterium]
MVANKVMNNMERKRLKEEAISAARARIIFFKQAFGTESGQKVLKELEQYCQVKIPSFVKTEGQHADPLELAFLDGRKSVYWYIQRLIEMEIPKDG